MGGANVFISFIPENFWTKVALKCKDGPYTTVRRIGIYQMRCTAYKGAPDDGLI